MIIIVIKKEIRHVENTTIYATVKITRSRTNVKLLWWQCHELRMLLLL